MTNIVSLGGDLERLSRKLEHEAQMFLARKRDGRLEGSRRWTIFDLEFLFDRSRHSGYIQAEGKDAELSIRWPFHQVAAVCWMTLEFIPGETIPVVEGPFVLTTEDADERTMVMALFNALEKDLGAVATTWGGEARDLAVLRRAATTHGLVLPHQLIDGSPYARERLDLCRASCVQASGVHLPELATAVGVPSKPTPSEDIGKHCEAGNWAKVCDQVVADTREERELAFKVNAAFAENLPGRFVREKIARDWGIKLIGAPEGANIPLGRVLWTMTFPDQYARDRMFAWLVHRIDRWEAWTALASKHGAQAFTEHILRLRFADEAIDLG